MTAREFAPRPYQQIIIDHILANDRCAVWAGMGIVMVSVAALFIYGQKLDIPAMLGMALIVLGVVVIQLFSKTAGH